MRDERLDELSGMVAVGSGFVVVNDGSDFADRRKIFYLNSGCRVTRTVSYPSRPRDTEDLARGSDGTLWVADIGDNGGSRSTIALWKLAPGAKKPVLLRMSYPDGAHDAEALLVTGDGTPIVITKSGGTAELYTPTAALRGGSTTPLKKAGEVTLPITTTSNPFSFLGRAVVTGAATSPDGRHVVLRTYADAFEFDVEDGDVIGALTSGTPRQIPLPNEPQGESVTYSADGTSLLTVSEASGDGSEEPVILGYALPDRPAVARATPSAPSSSAVPPTTSAPAAGAAESPDEDGPPFDYIKVVAGAVGALALILAIVVVALYRRARRSR
ncbi:hypothetical protein JIG36_02060 [Actinoplanes sp. LDG1-06]|uniref:Esterase-like activity of phytase family protein n=1 Tax=Paractinoplanes ovalisporus TaxID=2810368 RepID=A0ABS2A3C3_9ACTN|nr:hypothetical protein [Actinoplanes ovalisporus]MBM2614340.1 hypothetical protein [Actinoplanes ovalisporus]